MRRRPKPPKASPRKDNPINAEYEGRAKSLLKNAMVQRGFERLVVIGAPGESKQIEGLAAAGPGSTVVDLVGQTTIARARCEPLATGDIQSSRANTVSRSGGVLKRLLNQACISLGWAGIASSVSVANTSWAALETIR